MKRLALSLLSLCTASSLADAETTRRFSLSVVREDGLELCPDADRLRERVAEHLGRSPLPASDQSVVEVHFKKPNEGGVEATVRVRSASGQSLGRRSFSDGSCAGVGEAVALAVALQMDPDALTRSAPPSPSASVPKTLPAINTPQVAAPPRDPMHGGLSLNAVGAAGLLPRASIGARVLASLDVAPMWKVRAGARLFPEVQTGDSRFAFGLNAADVGMCRAIVEDLRWNLHACAAFAAGEVHSVVFKLEPTQPGARAWFGLDAEAATAVRIGPLVTLEGGVGLTVPLTRQVFTVGGEPGHVFQQAPVVPFARVGLGLSFSGRSSE